MNTKLLGDAGQKTAAKYLERKGYRVLEQNFLVHGGEIDIIAFDAPFYVFVEVKTRSNELFGMPSEAVNAVKQQRLRKAAAVWLHKRRLDLSPCRFDVIEVRRGEVNHIENAF